MKILISLSLLLSVLSFAHAQESETPAGTTHCSNARFDTSAPSSATQSSDDEVIAPTSIDG